MQTRTPIFAQAADLGLGFWFPIAFFVVAAALFLSGALFLLLRSFFRFGAQRVPLAWVLGLADLLLCSLRILLANGGCWPGYTCWPPILLEGAVLLAQRSSEMSHVYTA